MLVTPVGAFFIECTSEKEDSKRGRSVTAFACPFCARVCEIAQAGVSVGAVRCRAVLRHLAHCALEHPALVAVEGIEAARSAAAGGGGGGGRAQLVLDDSEERDECREVFVGSSPALVCAVVERNAGTLVCYGQGGGSVAVAPVWSVVCRKLGSAESEPSAASIVGCFVRGGFLRRSSSEGSGGGAACGAAGCGTCSGEAEHAREHWGCTYAGVAYGGVAVAQSAYTCALRGKHVGWHDKNADRVLGHVLQHLVAACSPTSAAAASAQRVVAAGEAAVSAMVARSIAAAPSAASILPEPSAQADELSLAVVVRLGWRPAGFESTLRALAQASVACLAMPEVGESLLHPDAADVLRITVQRKSGGPVDLFAVPALPARVAQVDGRPGVGQVEVYILRQRAGGDYAVDFSRRLPVTFAYRNASPEIVVNTKWWAALVCAAVPGKPGLLHVNDTFSGSSGGGSSGGSVSGTGAGSGSGGGSGSGSGAGSSGGGSSSSSSSSSSRSGSSSSGSGSVGGGFWSLRRQLEEVQGRLGACQKLRAAVADGLAASAQAAAEELVALVACPTVRVQAEGDALPLRCRAARAGSAAARGGGGEAVALGGKSGGAGGGEGARCDFLRKGWECSWSPRDTGTAH